MSSSVHFKMFHNRQSPDVETVNFTGTQIKLLELKRSIVEKKKFSQGMNFDLTILDANNPSRVYSDDNSFVPKDTTVVVKRKPVPSGGIGLLARLQGGSNATSTVGSRVPSQKQEEGIVIPKKIKAAPEIKNSPPTEAKVPPSPVLSAQPLQASSEATLDEEMAMLKSLSQKNSTSYRANGVNKVWTADGKYEGSADSRGQGSVKPISAASRRPNVAPPPEYRCNRCMKKGHYIAHCPTNNDHSFDRSKLNISNSHAPDGKLEKSVGVPQPTVQTVKDLTGVDTLGKVVVPVKDGFEILTPSTNQFASLVTRGGAKSSLADLDLSAVPPPLKCPLSDKLLRDAVSTPCCHRIVSDEGYRKVLFQTQELRCPLCNREGVIPDELVPHKETKVKVEDFLLKVLGPVEDSKDESLVQTEKDDNDNKKSEDGPPPPPPPPPPPTGPAMQASGPPPFPPVASHLGMNVPPPINMNGPPMNLHGPAMGMGGPPMGMGGPPMGMGGPPMTMGGPPMNMNGPPMHVMNGNPHIMTGPGMHQFHAQRKEYQSIMGLFDNGPFPKVWDLPPMTLDQFVREQGLQQAYFEEQARRRMGQRPGERRQRELFIPNRNGTSSGPRGEVGNRDRRLENENSHYERRHNGNRRELIDEYDGNERSRDENHSVYEESPPRGGRGRGRENDYEYQHDRRNRSNERSKGYRNQRRDKLDDYDRQESDLYDDHRDVESSRRGRSRSRSDDRGRHPRRYRNDSNGTKNGGRGSNSKRKRSGSVDHRDNRDYDADYDKPRRIREHDRDQRRDYDNDRHSERRPSHRSHYRERERRDNGHHRKERISDKGDMVEAVNVPFDMTDDDVHNVDQKFESYNREQSDDDVVSHHDDFLGGVETIKEDRVDDDSGSDGENIRGKSSSDSRRRRHRHRRDEHGDKGHGHSGSSGGKRGRVRDREYKNRDDLTRQDGGEDDRKYKKHRSRRRDDGEEEIATNERPPKLGRVVSDASVASNSSMHHKRRIRR